jgi:hypothetical protein
MGLFQKGRSRTWLDDRGWWVGVVEFQPSSWARGSYLNVGCMWLWGAKDYISFDEGYRVERFLEFRNEMQFEAQAKSLAERAALEVARYRKLFPNVHEVCVHYLRQKPTGFWPNFHAAVACALAGEGDEARRHFKQVADWDAGNREWFIKEQAEARFLSAIVDDVARFRAVVAERVHLARKLQKLPILKTLNFDQ